MRALIFKIFKLVKSRFALNVYFWLLALNLMYNNIQEQKNYPAKWYVIFVTVNLLLIILLVYFNNLLLVPKLLAKKKRAKYFLSVILLAVVIASIYTALQKYIVIHFPMIKIIQISFISGPLTPEWTLGSFIDEFQTYFVAFLMLIFVFTALWHMHDYSRQEKLNQEAAKKQTETELTFLKNQLNPHFLFNTLNNLYGLSLTKSDDAPIAILKLSSLMRYMLYESDVKLISFEKESEAIHAYIDLELLRMDKSQQMDLEIKADKNYLVPPLLWLPILENVFKHGTRLIADKYLLDFKFVIENNILEITSSNYFKAGNENVDGGIGLENLRKRLSILFPGKFALDSYEKEQVYFNSLKIFLGNE